LDTKINLQKEVCHMKTKNMTAEYEEIDFLTFNVIDDTLQQMFRENYEAMLPTIDQVKPCDRKLVAHIHGGNYERV